MVEMKAGKRLARAHFGMVELYEKWDYAKTPAEAYEALANMQRGIAELSDAIAAASRETPDRYFDDIIRTRKFVKHDVRTFKKAVQRRPGDIPIVSHVRRRPKSIVDRFGHRVRVKEWPSSRGMATLRRHYKRNHPVAWRLSVMKGVRTRRRRREETG